jgi:hypothetical protein
MYFDALAIIFVGALAAGAILYIPGYFFAKWVLRRASSNSRAKLRITRTGFFVYGLMVVLMMLGFAQEHLAPATLFGHLVSSWFGRLAFVALLVVVFTIIERLLAKAGVLCVVRKTA